ncbi:MAG: YwbE family protein, partial [Thermoproteota archaeon]|nr:YwbE family protein [Thermoproteota archaeon]
ILTNSKSHPHGIKVLLENGVIGRVKEIVEVSNIK